MPREGHALEMRVCPKPTSLWTRYFSRRPDLLRWFVALCCRAYLSPARFHNRRASATRISIDVQIHRDSNLEGHLRIESDRDINVSGIQLHGSSMSRIENINLTKLQLVKRNPIQFSRAANRYKVVQVSNISAICRLKVMLYLYLTAWIEMNCFLSSGTDYHHRWSESAEYFTLINGRSIGHRRDVNKVIGDLLEISTERTQGRYPGSSTKGISREGIYLFRAVNRV